MRILFATDHAGYELKEALVPFVRDVLGFEVADLGASSYEEGDDYPTLIAPAAKAIAEAPATNRAIILGGSGQGEAMCANRFKGIRAAVYYGGPLEIISLSREHNDANILSLGARFLTLEEAKAAVELWLKCEPASDERHMRRRALLDESL